MTNQAHHFMQVKTLKQGKNEGKILTYLDLSNLRLKRYRNNTLE